MRVFSLSLALSLFLPGCIANDDAGDAAFVSRAVPAVLGRKVHGAVELDILTQIAQTYGRGALVDVLMDQPEYAEYWTHVLAEDLEVQYGSWAGASAQTETCFNTANVVLSPTDVAAADDLATFLRGAIPALSVYSTPFTMLDALRAGVIADDLVAPYVAAVMPLASFPGTDRALAEMYFNRAYLGKDADCYSCHSSTWSTTDDPSPGWDRFAPFPLDVESGLYDTLTVTSGTCSTNDLGCNKYQSFCSGCHGPTGDVARQAQDGDWKRLRQRVPVLTDAAILAVMENGTGNMGDPGVSSGAAAQILNYLRRQHGTGYDTEFYFRPESINPSSGGTQPLNLSTACSARMSASVPVTNSPNPPPTTPMFAGGGSSTASPLHIARRVHNAGGWTSTSFFGGTTIQYGNPAYDSPQIYGTGNFALAMSEQIVDNVLEEVWGERHTLGHGFERSEEGSYDRNARAIQFMDSGWSLRTLVKSAVLSEHFNRRAPETSLVTSNAYVLMTYLNPWAMVASPTGAHEENKNGQGDAVHRYTPDNLYWSVHHGLGWNAPDIVEPANTTFPGYDFRQRVGDYTDFFQRGTSKWSTGSLLYWEQAVGTCNAANGGGADWVTDLLDEAYLAQSSYTVEDLVKATRDRLLSSPVLIPGEETDLLAAMTSMGLPSVPNLAVPLTGYSRSQIEPFVRRYCGALLTTPDYLLGGLPLVDDIAPEWPVLEVCLPGEPCGATATCAYWEDALADRSVTWSSCNDQEPPNAPPPPSGEGPIDPTERVSIEDEAAATYGYSTETEYDAEIDENLYAEYKDDIAEYEAYDERAVAAEQSARAEAAVKYAYVCEGDRACDSVASAWERGLEEDEALLRADAEETQREVSADGTYVATWAELSWESYGDWYARTLVEASAAETAAEGGDEYAAILAAAAAENDVEAPEAPSSDGSGDGADGSSGSGDDGTGSRR